MRELATHPCIDEVRTRDLATKVTSFGNGKTYEQAKVVLIQNLILIAKPWQHSLDIGIGAAIIADRPPTAPGMRIRTGRFESLRAGESGHSHLIEPGDGHHAAQELGDVAPPTAVAGRHLSRNVLSCSQCLEFAVHRLASFPLVQLDRSQPVAQPFFQSAPDVWQTTTACRTFAWGKGAALDRLLTTSVASLIDAGEVQMTRVAQDGMRVRASAGAASFRRKPKLQTLLAQESAQVQQLKREVDNEPAATAKRLVAARERASREREERLAKALERIPALQAIKQANGKSAENARASTTDLEATVMKMGRRGLSPCL